MKTITLKIEMNFTDALNYLLEGKCVGIRPTTNSNYIEIYKPTWMNIQSQEYMLKWHGRKEDNNGIRTNQYLEVWFPVIVDHRELNS